MSLSRLKYAITDWHGSVHLLTAKQLYERVLQDCQSDYNWIAPARELVKACNSLGFPDDYALPIKIAILNCFANVERRANCGGDRYRDDPADEKAVQHCYNSLYGICTEDAISARKNYLTQTLITASCTRVFDPHYHSGPTYRKLLEDWRKSKFEECISQENIDFKQLLTVLQHDFEETVKAAEANGDFEEDDKKSREDMAKFWSKINDL